MGAAGVGQGGEDWVMVEPRCSRCRWYEEIERCTPSVFVCSLATSEDGRALHLESKAKAADGEGYYATLVVQPDFGCVQYEGRA